MSVLRSTCVLGRLLGGIHLQSLKIPSTQVRCVTMNVTKVQPPTEQTFEERNAAARRPISPHLTIYQPQLTWMMSIFYRFSGVALSGYAVILASSSFFTSDMSQVAQAISDFGIPSFMICTLKYFVALPATYHLFNGIRHLSWDTGRFLTIKNVYIGGYLTLVATFMSAIYLAV